MHNYKYRVVWKFCHPFVFVRHYKFINPDNHSNSILASPWQALLSINYYEMLCNNYNNLRIWFLSSMLNPKCGEEGGVGGWGRREKYEELWAWRVLGELFKVGFWGKREFRPHNSSFSPKRWHNWYNNQEILALLKTHVMLLSLINRTDYGADFNLFVFTQWWPQTQCYIENVSVSLGRGGDNITPIYEYAPLPLPLKG